MKQENFAEEARKEEIKRCIENRDILKLRKMYAPLIKKWIGKYSWANLEKEDLKQESIIALIRACDKFDQSMESSFGVYLQHWIHYQLGQYVLRNVNVIRPNLHFTENPDLITETNKKDIDDYKNFSYINIDDPDCDLEIPEECKDVDRKICGQEILQIAKKELKERNFNIILGRINGKPLRALAKEHKLSQERIRQIEFASFWKIREKIGF